MRKAGTLPSAFFPLLEPSNTTVRGVTFWNTRVMPIRQVTYSVGQGVAPCTTRGVGHLGHAVILLGARDADSTDYLP